MYKRKSLYKLNMGL